MVRRILCIDGGGIKGVFPASFLATIEESIGSPVSDFFDLIVGTSTGGIIALGLGLGLSASDLLRFYEKCGPAIFNRKRGVWGLRHLVRAKYDSKELRNSLLGAFGNKLLGESNKRLVVPSFNVDTGEVHIWKTAHHIRLERDYLQDAVDVALATTAAPTYFPAHRSRSGEPLIDGGVWANNPVAIAVVEAIGILKWDPTDLRVLSLGCTTAPLDIDWGRRHTLGLLGWAGRIIDVFMKAQSESAIGIASHLLSKQDDLVRISPSVGKNRFQLDGASEIPSLRGMGNFEARKALPRIRPVFFTEPAPDDFKPFHKIDLDNQPTHNERVAIH